MLLILLPFIKVQEEIKVQNLIPLQNYENLKK